MSLKTLPLQASATSSIIKHKNEGNGKVNEMKQIIKINGKSYDAITGQIVTDDIPEPVKPKSAKTSVKTVAKQPTTVAKKPAAKHVLKSSQTLMRAAVKKPAATSLAIKVQPELTVATAKPMLTYKTAANRVSPVRKVRASSIEKSGAITRFGEDRSNSFSKLQAHVPVRIAPDKPLEEEDAPVPEPQRTNDPSEMFTKAIAQATHYTDVKTFSAAYRKKARRHFTSMAAAVTALLLLAGFAAYINSPGLQIKVAGMQAGISTMNPGLDKAGFAYGGVSTVSDKRVINMSAGEHHYQLVQERTNWGEEQMINSVSSVGANGNPNYKTMKINGQTVYRLTNGNATWIKNGVWYQLNGERAVSDKQLSDLVQNS